MLTPKQALKQYFGFDQFREGQEQVVQRALDQKHTLLVMPTGSGKSLTYQLPALILPGLTLVISPLIALMQDQVDGLTEAGVSATYINSALPAHEANSRIRAVLEGHVKLLYVAPERLRNNRFMQSLARVKISLLAVDEAHCVSQWGHDFRPDYLRIQPAWEAMGSPTILATTATATPDVQKQIVKILGVQKAQIVVAGFNRPNLHLSVKHLPDDQAKLQTLQSLLHKVTDGCAIVYTATRKNSMMVAEFIRGLGISAQAYHAGLDRDIRYRVQHDFMADRLRVVVATNAFGMGVDKATVRLVVHYNMPGSVEAYYQEAGRAGRDGQAADCVILFTARDQGLQEWLIRSDIPTYENMEQLYHMLNYLAKDGLAQASTRELADSMNMYPTKLRVTLSELEIAGLILHQGAQGFINQWRVLPLSKQALKKRDQAINKRVESRLTLLRIISQYVYLDSCRRKYLLNYFGDVTPPKSPRCCDNHADDNIEDLPRAATPEEWYPLIVLETVATLPRAVGRAKLAEILVGSRSKNVTQFGYDRHKFFGKLGSRLSQRQIMELINTLIQARYARLTGGDRPVVEVSPLGNKAIEHRAALPVAVPKKSGSKGNGRAKAQPTPRRRDTVQETLELFRDGYSPMEIGIERNIKETTVYNHLIKLIEQDQIQLHEIVPEAMEAEIRQAIELAGGTEVLFPIKVLLSDAITYEQIRCVVAAPSTTSAPASPLPELPDKSDPIRRVVSLGGTGDASHLPELIEALHHEDGNLRRLAASALGKIGHADGVEPLLQLLETESLPQVRQYAVNALGKIGDARAQAMLETIIETQNDRDYVLNSAKAALRKIST